MRAAMDHCGGITVNGLVNIYHGTSAIWRRSFLVQENSMRSNFGPAFLQTKNGNLRMLVPTYTCTKFQCLPSSTTKKIVEDVYFTHTYIIMMKRALCASQGILWNHGTHLSNLECVHYVYWWSESLHVIQILWGWMLFSTWLLCSRFASWRITDWWQW